MTDPARPPLDETALSDLLRRALADEAPPAALRDRVQALASPARRLAGRAALALRRLVATLVSDGSAGAPLGPAYGVRGSAAAASRLWLFRAEEVEIDLRATPQGPHWVIAGQLFGAPPIERVVLDDGTQPTVAELDATREFRFAGLPPGLYSLSFEGGEVDIVIPRLDIGTPDPPA